MTICAKIPNYRTSNGQGKGPGRHRVSKEFVDAEGTHGFGASKCEIALLTGGADKPYALGLASALISQGLSLDFIGSNDVDGPELHGAPQVNFLNLRGDQAQSASRLQKVLRVARYYRRLVSYAATAEPPIFHILWNNKFELFDRTILMRYYRLLGKQIVFTAHNINAGERDGYDSRLNRLTLGIQYNLSDHIFVHTDKMKSELVRGFRVPEARVTVIPFGINNTLPNSGLTTTEAKRMLGLSGNWKVMLFFGNIAPYKGLEYLIAALDMQSRESKDYCLIIAGRPKGCEKYWDAIQEAVERCSARDRIVQRIEYIPDENVEIFFKAADVLVLPYTHIFQSGVLFLAYNFGLPVIAADVGSLKEDIVEGKTGFVFQPGNAVDLSRAIETYFSSNLFSDIQNTRREIQNYARLRYSWEKVGKTTQEVYQTLRSKAGRSLSCAG